MSHQKLSPREFRKKRIRKKVIGTTERPRLSIHRSMSHFYAQVIDDSTGNTLLGFSTRAKDFSEKKKAGNVEGAKLFGESFAKLALSKKIEQVVFDRSGFIYHGRVKAFADGAREAGLKF